MEVGTLVEEELSVENPASENATPDAGGDLRHENIRQLHSGRILRLLMLYSIPAVISSTTASLYNIIDRIFIGHGVGPMAIAGLALTLPMMNMANAFGSLVGVGGGALVGGTKAGAAEGIGWPASDISCR